MICAVDLFYSCLLRRKLNGFRRLELDELRHNALVTPVTRIHKEFPRFILYVSVIDLCCRLSIVTPSTAEDWCADVMA